MMDIAHSRYARLEDSPGKYDERHNNPESTESRPNARDGLPGHGTNWCWDGEEAWIVCSQHMSTAIARFNEKTNEFTQYSPDSTPGMPRFRTAWCFAATKDYVFVGTDRGLVRFAKTDKVPQMTESVPRSGTDGVEIYGEIVVKFDMPLQPNTVNEQSVELWGNGAQFAGKASYDRDRNAVVLGVEKRLPSQMQCELILKSLIQGTNGNPIPTTRIAFTTK